jgi:hypothetical protein
MLARVRISYERETPDAAPARPDVAPTASREGRTRRLFTWRNVVLGGVGALAVLGLATAGWIAMRTLGIGPAATLVAKGVLEERDRIIVSELGTVSGDTILAETVTGALRVDLAQSPIVTIAEPRFIAAALARMEHPADTRLDR